MPRRLVPKHDTRTNCQSVGGCGAKIGNPSQRLTATAAMTMLAWVSSGCCEGVQRVKFRSSIGAG